MPAREKPRAEKRSLGVVRVPMNDAERARLDEMRGAKTRAAFIRSALFGDEADRERYRAFMAGASLEELKEPVPVVEVPAAPPPRPSLRIPPPNVPDAEGLLYHWEWKGKRWGTLTLIPSRPGQAGGYAVDLGDAELETHADGGSTLTYKDRTELRALSDD